MRLSMNQLNQLLSCRNLCSSLFFSCSPMLTTVHMVLCTLWTLRWSQGVLRTPSGRTFEGSSQRIASALHCPSSQALVDTIIRPSRPATWTSQILGRWWVQKVPAWTGASERRHRSAPSNWQPATSCWPRIRRRPSRPWRRSKKRPRRCCPASLMLWTRPFCHRRDTGLSATASGTSCNKRCSTTATFDVAALSIHRFSSNMRCVVLDIGAFSFRCRFEHAILRLRCYCRHFIRKLHYLNNTTYFTTTTS